MSPDAETQEGCLVIADISGYTAFLAGSELEHAQGILDELLNSVLNTLAPPFETANVEGDAVFCHAPLGRIRAGQPLVDLIDATYAAFIRVRERMERNTSCPCQACRKIPDLGLKFVAHFGAYAISTIGGRRELTGRDVILVHRLLKNSIIEKKQIPAYAFFSDAGMDAMGLSGVLPEAVAHEEVYEHLGTVRGVVRNLDAEWLAHRHDDPILVSDEDTWVELRCGSACSPADAWIVVTDPGLREIWMEADAVTETGQQDEKRGVGTVQHCAHGRVKAHHTIVDWRPYDRVTFDLRSPFGGRQRYMVTIEKTESGIVTRCRFTSVQGRNPLHTAFLRGFAKLSGLEQTLQRTQDLLEEQLRLAAPSASGEPGI
jgi:hypothetical protein